MKFTDFLFTAFILLVLIVSVWAVVDAQSTDHCVFINSTSPITVLTTGSTSVVSVGDYSLSTEYVGGVDGAKGWWAVTKKGMAVKVTECPASVTKRETW